MNHSRTVRSAKTGGLLRRLAAICGAASVLLAASATAHTPQAPMAGHDPLPKNAFGLPAHHDDRVLVAFHPKVPREDRYALIAGLGLEIDVAANNPYFYRLILSPAARKVGANVETTLKALLVDPRVRVAERDWIVTVQQTFPNDPMFSQLYGLHNTGQTGGTVDADIDAPQAWDIQRGSANVKVAVIDTGIDYNHPDLAANRWVNPGEIPGNGIDDDGNGFIDDVYGYDLINNDGDPMDDHSHGTHCAGTIGAVGNNGVGVVGVCWTVRLIGVKFLGAGGGGSTSDAVRSVDYARIAGAHIMSNSWGGGGYSQLLLEAIQRAETAGILFVAAAGNAGSNIDSSPFYPASYGTMVSNMMVVGATTHTDERAGFSNFGAIGVDIFAPGDNVVSTVPFALNGSGYTAYSGTSMATPHVAGAAALVLSHFPGQTFGQIKARLMSSSEAIPALAGLSQSGRLNAYNGFDNDTTPPGTPSSMVGIKRSAGTIRLQWISSGDDGSVGTASQYDLRVSTSPINAGNFMAARRILTTPAPAVSGTLQNAAAGGLNPGTPYYFALRAIDNVWNLSGIATAGPYTTLPALFTDNMEGAPSFTPQPGSLWALTTATSYSPTKSWTDSPGGNYANNVNAWLQMNAPIAVTSPMTLRFMMKAALERNYDYLYVEASTNGVTWTQLYRTDQSFDWSPVNISLSGFVGQTIQLRFRLTTDSSVVYDGVYIDDLVLVAQTQFFFDNLEGAMNFSGDAPWALTTALSASPTRSWTDSPGGSYVNNLDISLTQNASVALADVEDPQVVFKMWLDLESGYDFLTVYSSPDNGATYQAGRTWSGSNQSWASYSSPIAAGTTTRLRFRLTTDYSVVYDGVYIDDIALVGEPCEPIVTGLPISGTITLEDWVGAVPGVPVVVEVRNVGSTTPLEAFNTTLGSGGTFAVTTNLSPGNYDITVKGPNWLRRKAANRTLTGSGMAGVNLSLKNGDVDGDNEVNIGDYAILSANFGLMTSFGDLDGDGEVTIGDYAILSVNYNLLGDD